MSKVIVIGLDGATFELIEPWVEKGKLPNFGLLMEGGAWGPLKSTLPPLTVPAWATMFTGKNPGKLGLFGMASRKKNDYFIGGPPVDWEDIYPIWEIAEKFALEASVINVPTTSVPDTGFSGPFIAGTGPMIGKSESGKLAQPEELNNWLQERNYRLHLRPSKASRKSTEGKRSYLKKLEELTDSRFEAAKKLINEQNWDLFIYSLFHTDLIQHIFWRDYLRDGKFKSAILNYYQLIDRKIGNLLGKAPQETNVIIVSDHGHTQLEKELDLNRFLVENGWMSMQSERKNRLTQRGIAELLAKLNLKKAYKKIRELPGIRKINSKLRGSVPLDKVSSKDVDWESTYAYSYCLGGVYLNVSGREPKGIVEEGREYEEIRENIISSLRELKDPETGELAVNQVFKREEVYSGPYLDEAPDILIDFSDKYQNSHSEPAPQHKQVFNEPSSFFTSTHTKDGIFVASGPEIKSQGKLGKGEGLDIQDMTPLILHLLGASVPNNLDGKVPRGIFKEGSDAVSRQPEFFEPPSKVRREKELTEEEDEEVKERLEDLGYL